MIIYVWKEELREEGIKELKNKSRAPINKRDSELKEEVKEYIRQYRIKYIGVSKERFNRTIQEHFFNYIRRY